MNNENTVFENRLPSLKDELCVWAPPVKLSGESDISEEYILPDYLPDIRKILLVKSIITNKEISATEGSVGIDGNVSLNVVYVGNSGEIGCIKQTYSFSDNIRSENIYDDSVISSVFELKNRSVRAMGPRKLVIKCKVAYDLSVRNKLCVSPRLVGGSGIEDEFSLERKISEIEGANHLHFLESDIRVSEDVEYRGKEPISDLVSYEVQPFVTECKYVDGKVNIKGQAKLWCLIACGKDDSVYYEVVEKSIPINHSFEAALPGGLWNVGAVIEMGETECGLANDSYGECRLIQLDFDCIADVNAISNETILFTDDVFSTKYDYRTDKKSVSTEKLAKMLCANFSASGNGELGGAENEVYSRIFMTSSDVDMRLENVKNGRGIFVGECNMKVVAEGDNGNYVTGEFSFPIKYECSVPDIDEYTAVCNCRLLDSRVSLDGNKINANVEVGINATVLERITADTVDTVTIDKDSPINNARDNMMVLYYPEIGETLWDVAKKYSVSRAALEKANNKSLSENLPRVIIIPSNN